MDPMTTRPAPSATSFKLKPSPAEESVQSDFPGDTKSRTEDLADSDSPFAVNLYPGRVRVHVDQHVYSEGSSAHNV